MWPLEDILHPSYKDLNEAPVEIVIFLYSKPQASLFDCIDEIWSICTLRENLSNPLSMVLFQYHMFRGLDIFSSVYRYSQFYLCNQRMKFGAYYRSN